MHPGQGRVRRDAPGGLDAVDDRHLDVDERDVGQVFPGQGQALAAVGGLGHHLDVVFEVEERAESAANERLVVDQQDADHDICSTGSSAWTVKPRSLRGPAHEAGRPGR